MAWTTPLTAVANVPLTAAQWNASVRDNLLETAVAKASAVGQHFVATGVSGLAARISQNGTVNTVETTASTTYTNLATVGPQPTVTVSSFVIIGITAKMANNTSGQSSFASYRVSGASVSASSDTVSVQTLVASTVANIRASAVMMLPVAAGASTFTMEYRVTAGTGTFEARHSFVIPF
jgi:hypothetical protein